LSEASSVRWTTALLSGSVAAHWGLAWHQWPELPVRVPLHFDFAGTPDRYGERGYWSWFFLPTLATGFALLFGLLIPRLVDWLAERDPTLINLPDKQRFLALAPERRRRALRPLLALLQVLGCEVVALFAWIQYGTLQVALGAWSRLPASCVLVVIAVLLATGLSAIPLTRRAVARAAAS
jgi:hypothetical protein